MKPSFAPLLSTLALAIAAPAPLEERAGTVQGFDISHYQGTVDFKSAYSSGARFVIIKVNQPVSSPVEYSTQFAKSWMTGDRKHDD